MTAQSTAFPHDPTPEQIAERLLSEGLLTLSQAARLLVTERGDGKVSPVTLWRWATKGKRGKRLEACYGSGQLCTSRQALARFLAIAPPDPPIKLADKRRHAASVRFLRRHGIG